MGPSSSHVEAPTLRWSALKSFPVAEGLESESTALPWKMPYVIYMRVCSGPSKNPF